MPNEKDITEKHLLYYNDVFADVANGFLFGGEQIIDQNDLSDTETLSQFKADGEIHQQERDVAKIWTRGGVRIAILGIENQTAPDKDMPLRVIGYDGASYKEQVLQHDASRRDKTKRLELHPTYPVVTLVINYGDKPWDQTTSLLDTIGRENIPKPLLPYMNDYKVHVFDVCRLKKEDLERFHGDFQQVMKLFYSRINHAPYRLDEGRVLHVDGFAKLMDAVTQQKNFVEIADKIPDKEKKAGVNVSKFFDEIFDEMRAKTENQIFSVMDSYERTHSVAETAKENDLSEEKTAYILKRAHMIPS